MLVVEKQHHEAPAPCSDKASEEAVPEQSVTGSSSSIIETMGLTADQVRPQEHSAFFSLPKSVLPVCDEALSMQQKASLEPLYLVISGVDTLK